MTTINGDEVTIEMSRADLLRVIYVFGMAMGCLQRRKRQDGPLSIRTIVLIVNQLFEGVPLSMWTPYEVPEDASEDNSKSKAAGQDEGG